MNNFFRKLVPYLVAATFIMPLIVGNNYIFPFIVPKILFFRSLVLVLLGCYILLLISDFQRFRPRFTLFTISILLFWLSFGISTFAGVDWYHSFWDNHERMLGLFTITHYTILYVITSSVLDTERDWKIVFRTALILGALVMIVGIWQKFVDPQYLLNNGSSRVSATLGNSIYYSGYGLFLMFMGAIFFFREKSAFWKWVAAVVGLLGFFGIFLGGTRGAVLGLIFGCAAIAASYIFVSREKTKGRKIVTYLSIIGVIILGILVIFRHTSFVSGIPGLGRLLNTSFSLNSAENTRPMAWAVGVDAWKEMPIFGWGPNNFYYAFNKYYRPEFLKFGWNETWFDNAHSIIFNTLVVQGIVGILLYICIYIAAFSIIFIGVRRSIVPKQLGFLMVGFLSAHFVSLVTVFENPTSYLYFFIFAAFISHSTRGVILKKKEVVEIEEEDPKKQKKTTARIISVGSVVSIGLLMFCIMYITDIAPARANKATIAAIQKIYAGTADGKIYDDALTYATPHLDDIRNDISRTVLGSLPGMVQQKKNDQVLALFNVTVQELKKNQLLHPLDVRVYFTLSQVFEFGYQATQKKEFLSESEIALRQALTFSPKRQQIIYSLGQNLAEQGRFSESEELLQKSNEDYPQIGEGWVRLALMYAAENKVKEAREIAGKVLGWYGDPNIFQLDPSWKNILSQLVATTTATTTAVKK